MKTHPELLERSLFLYRRSAQMFMTVTGNLSAVVPDVVSTSRGWMNHSDVNGIFHAPGALFIFLVEDLHA